MPNHEHFHPNLSGFFLGGGGTLYFPRFGNVNHMITRRSTSDKRNKFIIRVFDIIYLNSVIGVDKVLNKFF